MSEDQLGGSAICRGGLVTNAIISVDLKKTAISSEFQNKKYLSGKTVGKRCKQLSNLENCLKTPGETKTQANKVNFWQIDN